MPIFRTPTGDEIDAIIAALRLWQNVADGRLAIVQRDGNPSGLDFFEDVATCSGKHPALDADQLDTLLLDVFGVA